MAHNIKEHDVQQGREMAWHGLTQIQKNLSLGNNWLRTWEPVPSPLLLPSGKESGFSAFVASDNPEIVIGKPFAESYSPILNGTILDVLERSLEGYNFTTESLGSVRNRGRIFVTVKLDEVKDFKAGNRQFAAFLNFLSSHDMSAPFSVMNSNTCTVCDNTFTWNLHSKGKNIDIRIPHTKAANARIQNIPAVIAAAIESQRMFAKLFEQLACSSVASDDAKAVFAGFVGGKNPEGKLPTRGQNIVTRLHELFMRGRGNIGQNRADMFSAVTDYYSHESSGGNNRWKQFVSSEFGTGADRKRDFLNVLTDDDTFNANRERGFGLLLNAEQNVSSN